MLCGLAVKINRLQHIELFKTNMVLFSLLITNKYYKPKIIYFEFYKHFRERRFLVCLANYIKTFSDGCFEFIN